MLADVTVVDLSAPLGPSTVLWPGTPPLEATVTFDPADGSTSRHVSLAEHAGTHLDAPVHYAPHGVDVAAIPASSLVCELVVIDVSDACAADRDSVLTVDQVLEHEDRHTVVGRGSAVFLRTGWDRFRDDADAYRGGSTEQTLSFPGYGPDAARLLVEQRGVAGLGIDTLGIDAGAAGLAAPVHREVSLSAGVWHLENLVDLGRVPPTGAWVVVGVPRVEGATGFPARVLALVPATPST